MVNQAVDPARRTVEVWCEIPNAQRSLKAGVFGSVSVSVGSATRAIVLPGIRCAIQGRQQPRHRSRRRSAAIAHLREVEATPLPGGKVQIIRGIEAGETVVIEGGYGLPDGTQVTLAGTAEGGK